MLTFMLAPAARVVVRAGCSRNATDTSAAASDFMTRYRAAGGTAHIFVQ